MANRYPYIAGLHEGKEPPQVTWHHVDPRYGAVPIWLNKKLVYAEIGGSRLFGESFLLDVSERPSSIASTSFEVNSSSSSGVRAAGSFSILLPAPSERGALDRRFRFESG